MGEHRERIYRAFDRRNRLIGWLRIGVPMLGVLVLGSLLVQIVIANMARDMGISGIRIARDALVIDSPEYSGVMANGTQYSIVADAASTALGGQEEIALDNAKLDLVRTDGYRLQARAKAAQFSLADQIVQVDDVMIVTDNHDMEAKLLNSTIDWTAQTLVAKDNVNVVFGDGSILTGSSLRYDAGAQTWDFNFIPTAEDPRQ